MTDNNDNGASRAYTSENAGFNMGRSKGRKTTYGVMGLIEWSITFRVGLGKVKVHFSGGSMTKYGVTPATFTTDSEAVKMLIETSDSFINGRIFKL